ncbi:MAG: hypothetical protein ACRBN8_13825 [Nannocystales bacterium]
MRWLALLCVLFGAACDGSSVGESPAGAPEHGEAIDPDQAPRVSVDRFGPRRAEGSGELPAPNEPIDLDGEFTTRGLGPDGQEVAYYDLGPATGATMPVFRLVDIDGAPVDAQLPIITVAPGDVSYSDFWQVTEIEVPEGYEANTITSASEVAESGYPQTLTAEVLNRPVVPEGSSARFATDQGRLHQAWLEDQVALSFDFSEAEPNVRGALVDYVAIYVCLTESGTFCADSSGSTHNVVAAVPTEPGYSPLWKVNVYPEAAFDAVGDLDSALAADPQPQPLLVNCPLIEW